MEVLRTPDERFENLPGFPFAARYVDVEAPSGSTLRMHYIDEGPRDAPPIWLQHGLPAWSFHFRRMIPTLVDAGFRVVAPDLMGHGRSDKPTFRPAYTVEAHIGWIHEWLIQLDLTDVTLLCHDWGAPISLGVLTREEARFERVLVTNTVLYAPDTPLGGLSGSGISILRSDSEITLGAHFADWLYASQALPTFADNVMPLVFNGYATNEEARAGYEAPFPDYRYEAALRQFPLLNPFTPHHPTRGVNAGTWDFLSKFHKPLLTVFSNDPGSEGAEKPFQELVPGAKGLPHVMLDGPGHFACDEIPDEFSKMLLEFIRTTA